jgi:hypothetical protein
MLLQPCIPCADACRRAPMCSFLGHLPSQLDWSKMLIVVLSVGNANSGATNCAASWLAFHGFCSEQGGRVGLLLTAVCS